MPRAVCFAQHLPQSENNDDRSGQSRRMNRPSLSSPTSLFAKQPEDLLAFVPQAIGFNPECSVVMITFTEHGNAFHGRVDLPAEEDHLENLVAVLLRPALKHGVLSVIFAIYDDDTRLADDAAWSLKHGFEAAGVAVLDVLRVHDGEWFAVLPGRPAKAYAGVPFDIAAHPFTVRGVVEGRVTHASREALRATLAACEPAVVETLAALESCPPLSLEQIRPLVERHQAARSKPSAEELAGLSKALITTSTAEHAVGWLTRAKAREAVELWTDALTRLPDSHIATPAAVLALAAWLAGDGALAWCAIDRCRAVESEHSLANLVAGLLDSAASPNSWSPSEPRLPMRD